AGGRRSGDVSPGEHLTAGAGAGAGEAFPDLIAAGTRRGAVLDAFQEGQRSLREGRPEVHGQTGACLLRHEGLQAVAEEEAVREIGTWSTIRLAVIGLI